ncbi:MAG: hypothetical protein Q9225_005355, partial [Loekoesia sp. 1 TL-2023]
VVQDAMEMLEKREGGNLAEARRFVEGLKLVHEACGFAVRVSRYDDLGMGMVKDDDDWAAAYFYRYGLDYVEKL